MKELRSVKISPLFEIDPTQYKAAVNQAKAAVAMADANVKTLTLTEKNKERPV